MDFYNGNLYLLWVLSMIPMLIIAFYGLMKCRLHVVDFVIIAIVSVLPLINTMVLVMLGLFSVTDFFKRNDSNQY